MLNETVPEATLRGPSIFTLGSIHGILNVLLRKTVNMARRKS
jgi:hypothetical protein